MTTVFFEAITEVNIKQEGSVEGKISSSLVIPLEEKADKDKEGEEERIVQDI